MRILGYTREKYLLYFMLFPFSFGFIYYQFTNNEYSFIELYNNLLFFFYMIFVFDLFSSQNITRRIIFESLTKSMVFLSIFILFSSPLLDNIYIKISVLVILQILISLSLSYTSLIRYRFLTVVNGALLVTTSLFVVMLYVISLPFSSELIMNINRDIVNVNEQYGILPCNSKNSHCSSIFLSDSLLKLDKTYDYLLNILVMGSFSVWIPGGIFAILFHRKRISYL